MCAEGSKSLHRFCNRVRIGHSRSSKVDNFGTNWKRVCNFLLVGDCDYNPILHRFWHTATCWLKIAYFFLKPLSIAGFDLRCLIWLHLVAPFQKIVMRVNFLEHSKPSVKISDLQSVLTWSIKSQNRVQHWWSHEWLKHSLFFTNRSAVMNRQSGDGKSKRGCFWPLAYRSPDTAHVQ